MVPCDTDIDASADTEEDGDAEDGDGDGDGGEWQHALRPREFERRLVHHDDFFAEQRHFAPLPVPGAAVRTLSLHSDLRPSAAPRTLYGPMDSPYVVGTRPPPLPKDPAFTAAARLLDLRRITNRVIASGLPSSHRSNPLAYRNNLLDLARFLDARFPERYMVWNLAGDTSHGSYDIEPLHNRVVAIPLSKAYNLNLKSIMEVCRSMHAWLSLDPANVAIVHCTTGVGRTGAAIACYLRFVEIIPDAKEAFEYYVYRRANGDRSWVTVSLERYIDYFNNLMILGGSVPSPYPLRLHRVIINGIPDFDGRGACNPGLEIYESGKLVFTTASTNTSGRPSALQRKRSDSSAPDSVVHNTSIIPGWFVQRTSSSVIFRIPAQDPLLLEKDIQLRIFHTPVDPVTGEPASNAIITMFSFSFNSGFMPTSGIIRVALDDLEIARRDLIEQRFPSDFTIDVVISEGVSKEQEAEFEANGTASKIKLSYTRSLETSLLKCMSRLVCYHLVRINEAHMRTLEAKGINRVVGKSSQAAL
eukprot:jgi/Hompol1/6846/HPOL_001315-RA